MSSTTTTSRGTATDQGPALPVGEELQRELSAWVSDQSRTDARNPWAREQQLRKQHHDALDRRLALISAPPSREDVTANIDRLIRQLHDRLAADIGGLLQNAFGGGMDLRVRDGSVKTRPPHIPDVMRQLSAFEFACLFSPEDLVGSLEILLPADWTPGPAISERPARIAEIDAEIAAIETAHTAYVVAASKLSPPIELPLLDTVKQRAQLERDKAAVRERTVGKPWSELEARRRAIEARERTFADRQANE